MGGDLDATLEVPPPLEESITPDAIVARSCQMLPDTASCRQMPPEAAGGIPNLMTVTDWDVQEIFNELGTL